MVVSRDEGKIEKIQCGNAGSEAGGGLPSPSYPAQCEAFIEFLDVGNAAIQGTSAGQPCLC